MNSNSDRVILNFENWKILLEAVDVPAGDPPAGEDPKVQPFENKPVALNFKFKAGKWTEKDVDTIELAKIKKDLVPLIEAISTPELRNITYVLELTASTSISPVSKELIAQLASAGYAIDAGDKTGNSALCKARLATMSAIIRREIATALKIDINDPAYASKFQITQVSKPNSGGTADPNDPNNVQWQYIAFKLNQSGEQVSKDDSIECNMPVKEVKGRQANSANNYVGYERRYFLKSRIGSPIKLKLDPFNIPDAFYVKYGKFEYLSPFLGNITNVRWKNEYTNLYNQKKRTLKQIFDENGGARAFQLELAEMTDLQAKIDEKIASVGGTLKCESVTVGNQKAWNNGKPTIWTNNIYYPKIDIPRDFFQDEFTLIVFSPLDATIFYISSECK